MNEIKFQTYSWSYGTTSFRVSELKYKIERQLIRLKELRNIYPDKNWKDLQEIYFEMLLEEGLAKETSKNKAKDARQKTSPLVDLGLVDNERQLTEIGKKLYKINYDKNYNFNNLFFLRNDAFLYFKQLLKINFNKNKRAYKNFNINPFLSLIYLLIKFDSISKKVFMYALSLCQNFNDILDLEKFLKQNKNFNIYEYLENKIKEKNNYEKALKFFLENDKNLKTFEIVLMDRKSKKNSQIFLELFNELKTFNNSKDKFTKLKEIVNKFDSSKLKPEFRKRLCLNSFEKFKKLKLDNLKDEELFYFFHTSKWKVNLEDYYDLNKRFIELSEVIIFDNENIYLDELVKLYFEDELNNEKDYNKLLSGVLKFDENYFFNKIKDKYKIAKDENLRQYIKNIKLQNKKRIFDKLVNKYFSNDNLITLFEKIKKREDKYISSYVDWDANIPTIFEYLIGIVFYKISKTIDLDFLNMSLNASMLPIRFASGNKADIVFNFDEMDMIIEVTLTTDENQRRMELEPVIRHIGRHNFQKKAFGVFIAPYLDPNVLVIFRAYKNLNFYDINDYSKVIKGLEILPLSIDEIIYILKQNIDLNDFLDIKNSCISDKENDGVKWYKSVVKGKFNANQ
ncbi:AlwI family type II restriction endonuclease [Lebetimonas sp. JS138]|uniref:AlwI family type II restriction endonuclease n=1 Tax=Lebetimonas sp. JS138 TaxID=990072 RepID=UPI000466D330|nr:AlwI family type II restriction endonuclease [Lebetimonas sp. JS138]